MTKDAIAAIEARIKHGNSVPDFVWSLVGGALRDRLIREAKERETNNEQGGSDEQV